MILYKKYLKGDNIMKDKAILVVSFGTSYEETMKKTIEAIENDIKKYFPEYEVKRAFTSQMIINKLKAENNITIDTVEEALQKLYNEDYKTIICQPTHIINGIEFECIIENINKFKSKFDKILIGTPLLTTTKDYIEVAQAIQNELKNIENNKAVILMGHGTEHFSNSAYPALDYIIKEKGYKNFFVGTVEGYPDIDTVIELVKENNFKDVILTPLMIVAGDHAINDMASNKENSWKTKFISNGFNVEIVLKGLGEYSSIRNIFIEHINSTINRL